MILYGAGGHGKVVLEIVVQAGVRNIIFWDDADLVSLGNYPVIKPDATEIGPQEKMIITVGDNTIRKQLADQNANYIPFTKAVHHLAVISANADVRNGTVVMASAVMQTDSRVGIHCILNTGSIVDHDVHIGDYVHVGPGATVCGGVKIGEGTLIGAGATVLPNLTLGGWCTIGAGAVVLRDVPDFAKIVGNPGRIID